MRRQFGLVAFIILLFVASTLPASLGADAQVRDFIEDKGVLLDNFDSASNWAASTGVTKFLDSVDKVEGSAALKITTPYNNSGDITKTVSLNFSNARAFSIWVKLWNYNQTSAIVIYFSSSTIQEKYMRLIITPGEMPRGWTHLVLDKNMFTSFGGESWSSTMVKIVLKVSTASGGTPSVSFDDFTYDLEGRAKCVISFDDGISSDYALAKPVLDLNGQRAVSFVIPNRIGLNGYMTTMDLNNLYNSGWDIGSHGYYHNTYLDRMSASALDFEVNGAYNWLMSKGYTRSAPFYCYYGGRGFGNETVVSKILENHIFARTILRGWYQALLSPTVSDSWPELRTYEIHNNTLPSDAIAAIDRAINERGLLILTFHRLKVTGPISSVEYLVSDFEVISDYLASRSDMIDVVTLSDLLEYDRPSVLQVYEDEAGFWSTSAGGSGSIGVVDGVVTSDVHSGASSTRFQVVAGSSAYVSLYHDYPVYPDWSGYDALSFWWRGGDTDAVFDVYVYGPNWGNRYTAHFTDDFVGWRKVVLPESSFVSTGSPSWSKVGDVQILTTSASPATWLLDAAALEPMDVTLAVNVVGSGVVAKSPSYVGYAVDQVVTLTATPQAGWVFSGWSGDLTGTTNPASIVMNGDKTVTATFQVSTTAITFTASGLGGDATGTVLTIDGTPYTRAQLPKAFNWATGSTHTVTATNPVPATTGKRYSWVSWTNGDGLSGATGTYTVPASSQTVTVNYKTQYTLTVNAGGHGTPGGAGWYDANTNAQATMTPLTVPGSTGVQYVFTGWSGDASGTGSPSSNVLMNGPKTATANWKTQYQVSFAVSPAGSGSTSPSGTNVWVDAELAISAIPGTGYVFSSWTSDTPSITFIDSGDPSTSAIIVGSGTITVHCTGSPLVLDLRFNEDTSPIQDFSDYENTAMPYGGVTWSSSYGGCYNLDGADDYINRPTASGLSTSQLTYMFWSKQTTTSTRFMHPIGLLGGHSATIYVSPDTYYYYVKMSVSGVNYEKYIGTLDSEWHHFAVVFDGSGLKVYVDGVLRADVSAPGVIDAVDGSLFVGTTGRGSSPNGNYFGGLIDEVQVHSSALSLADVQTEYDDTKADHFDAVPTYTITASAGVGGSITPSGDVVVDEGADQLFTIEADTGYHILDVLVGGSSVGPVAEYTFYDVAAGETIEASFVENSPLVLDMPFVDASTPIDDASTYGNDGTPYGGVTWSSSYGGCYNLDGADDYINRPTASGLSTSQLTYMFWSKQTTTSTRFMHPIGLLGGHSATIYVSPDTYYYYVKMSVSGVNYEKYIGTLDSEWHHFAVVFDGSGLKVYVDGVLRADVSAPGVIDAVDGSLFVGTTGRGSSPNGNYFGGLIDEVQVHSSALSLADVQTEYDDTKADHFDAVPTYTITASAGVGGSITPSGDVVVDEGADQLFTIEADTGYHILDVLVGGSSVGPVAEYTFYDVAAGETIEASFVENSPLVLDMPFVDASTPIDDASTYGNDGTPYGGVTWSSSYGGCYNLDGADDYINRPTASGLSTSQLTYMFWSKQTTTSTRFMHPIGLLGGHSATIYVSPDTYYYYVKMSVSGVNYEKYIGTLDSEWHHFAVVFDGSGLKVYVDGVLRADVSAPGVIDAVDGSLFVGTTGRGSSPNGNYFGGLIDEVQVHSSALSLADVQTEYDADKAEHS